MSSTPFLTLHPHDDELRDPTREELFNGPKREKLPTAIQQMAQDDTACTFCGVSYFVFSEVQQLQASVKKYKKTFHDFVRFMERERQTSQTLKTQVLSLKKSFDDATSVFSSNAHKLALESQQLRCQDEQLTSQLQTAQRDAELHHTQLLQLQAQHRRDEDEWRLTSAFTDQKLRNEIVHLTSQLEKCKLLSASQEAEYSAEMESKRATIKELELLVNSTRLAVSSLERQTVTERDVLKQQLLAASERVDAERETARQLETQLRAVQHELQRVVSSTESEHAVVTQIQGELGSLKQQLSQHEKQKTVLVAERSELRDQVDKANELVRSFRLQIATLETQLHENARNCEAHKQQYARELETMRSDHSQTINRMQRDHQHALDELKTHQKTYVEYLQKQTSEAAAVSTQTIQHALVEMEAKRHEAERQAAQWKQEAAQRGEELQSMRLSQQQTAARIQALERERDKLDSEKRELVEETDHLQRQLDQHKAQSKQQLDRVQREEKSRAQQQLDDRETQFHRKLDALQARYDQLQRDHEQLQRSARAAGGRKTRDPEDDGDAGGRPRTPQQAWSDGAGRSDQRRSSKPEPAANPQTNRGGNNNQDHHHHELDKQVESLRRSLEQKDKEIFLLQQTVHRECLERTSLLEKMRSGKVLPDLVQSTSLPFTGDTTVKRSSSLVTTPRRDHVAQASGISNATDADDHEERVDDDGSHDPSQPKAASFYERLRRAGQRKTKPRKT